MVFVSYCENSHIIFICCHGVDSKWEEEDSVVLLDLDISFGRRRKKKELGFKVNE